MVYELRPWFDELTCLFTDDQRVKDLAVQSPELRVAAAYFRRADEIQPFAWDIVGPRAVLEDIAARFGARSGPRSSRRAPSTPQSDRALASSVQ